MHNGSSYGKEKYRNAGDQPPDFRAAVKVLQTQSAVSGASDPGIGIGTSDGDDVTVFTGLYSDQGNPVSDSEPVCVGIQQ